MKTFFVRGLCIHTTPSCLIWEIFGVKGFSLICDSERGFKKAKPNHHIHKLTFLPKTSFETVYHVIRSSCLKFKKKRGKKTKQKQKQTINKYESDLIKRKRKIKPHSSPNLNETEKQKNIHNTNVFSVIQSYGGGLDLSFYLFLNIIDNLQLRLFSLQC